jgi:hypothetical protein
MTDAKDASTFGTLRAVIASDPYHQQFQPLLDHIDTLTRERDAARAAFDTVISLAPIYCERLHHTKKDYHKSGEPCPVEARIKTLIQIIEGDA